MGALLPGVSRCMQLNQCNVRTEPQQRLYIFSPSDASIEVGGSAVELCELDGAFVRLNPRPAVAEPLGVSEEAKHIYTLERRQGLHWFLDEASFLVVNRPRAGRSNASKESACT